MSFVAAAVMGGSLITGLIGSNAAGKAAGQQAGAANRATDAQLQMFNTINSQQAPYRQAGYNSLDAIMRGLGLGGGQTFDSSGSVAASGAPSRDQFTIKGSPAQYTTTKSFLGDPGHQTVSKAATPDSFDQAGYDKALAAFNASQAPQTGANPVGGIEDGYFTHQFDANDLNDNLAPNWKFQLDQGLMAARNAGNLQTGLLSGNTLKGINDYAQNYAGNAYQQAYQNYTANQSNIFNRLSNIAGLGQTANQATGQAGSSMSGDIANSIMGAGTANAAGTVGAANALTGGANNALGWFSLSQIMNQGNAGQTAWNGGVSSAKPASPDFWA